MVESERMCPAEKILRIHGQKKQKQGSLQRRGENGGEESGGEEEQRGRVKRGK
jgi:hypothetical protein